MIKTVAAAVASVIAVAVGGTLLLAPSTLNAGAPPAPPRFLDLSAKTLVPLKILKPEPQWSTTVVGRTSAVLGTYDDGGTWWGVYVRYRGCPVTRRGAFRVTVYEYDYIWEKAPSYGQGMYGVDRTKPPHRYSTTAIDYRPSDDVLYTWPAHFPSTWQVHIDVPNRRGCRVWRYGSEGN